MNAATKPKRNVGRAKIPKMKIEQSETAEALMDEKSLKTELHLWIQTFHEIVDIFTDIVPAPDENEKKVNPRNTLFAMCKKVAKVAKNPKQSKEYQNLLKLFIETQDSLTELNQKCSQLNDNLNLTIDQSTIHTSETSNKSQLSIRLSKLDDLLSREIEQNEKYLPSNYQPIVPPKHQENSQPNAISKPPTKKGKAVFPTMAELLSPTFHDKTKNPGSKPKSNRHQFIIESDSDTEVRMSSIKTTNSTAHKSEIDFQKQENPSNIRSKKKKE